jgi:catechol 2,3-dioxygenase-like lactoylglutathione lyase family enzyme
MAQNRRVNTPPLRSPDAPDPTVGFVVTVLLIVNDIARSRDFYARVFDGKVVRDGSPAMIRIANTWLILNVGGGPTDDKPDVTASPPSSDRVLTVALNFRVAGIRACYELWKSRGARFLTEPKEHKGETRCYIADPDGHLIEVGQATESIT